MIKKSAQGGSEGSYIDFESTSPDSDEDNSPMFINTKNSYNDRRKHPTLIPGEVYSFYIHLTDLNKHHP